MATHVPESQLESLLQRTVTRVLGGMALKLAPTVAGAPDRMVLLPTGKVYLVELKTDRGRLSDIQEVWHERAAAIGVPVTTLYGRDMLLSWLRYHLARLIDDGVIPAECERGHTRELTISLSGKKVCVACATTTPS